MKKLLLIIALLISALGLNAQDATFGDLVFTITSETPAECEVSRYSGEPVNVIIPSKVIISGKEYTVTSIGGEVFWYCSSLTSIELPSGVASIGDWAFYNCSSLTSIEIPSGVTSIGSYAFSWCSSLTSIEIPRSVTSIGDEAFSHCDNLTSIVVESGNMVYDSRDNCNAIIETDINKLIVGCQNTVIPSSVTSIGEDAFSGCSSLTSIEIPSGVTSIGSYAFSWCSSLTSIEIPSGVISIGHDAFWRCSSLTSIDFGENSKLTSIGESAFQRCSSLTNIELPSSVTSIGEDAFGGCSLTSIIVESGNTVYDSRDNCNAIIETATNTLIAGCQNTIIPNTVTSIGNSAFEECSSLTSIEIPSGVTSIGGYAFSYCDNLTSIELPSGVTSIGYGAFYNCSSLTSIELPSGVTSIGNGAFSGCSYLTSIEIPSSVTSIEYGTFSDCSSLTSIEIPSGVTSIGGSAFQRCSSLTSIEIPSGVTSIGNYAFNNCSSLTSIYCYAESVPETDSYAFYNCLSDMVIYVPEQSVGAYKAASPWNEYTIKGSITIDYDGYSLGFAVINTEPAECEVSGYFDEPVDVTIPSSVMINGKEYSVTSIGYSAFGGCSSLTSIEIPNSVTYIGELAFHSTSLTSIEFPNSVTSIGTHVINSCPNIESVEIPSSLTEIGDYNFIYCPNLKSIKVNSSNPIYDSRNNCNALIETETNTLIAGCKNTIIPNTVTSIGMYAFINIDDLTSIEIPNSVVTICKGAFNGCDNLEEVVFEENSNLKYIYGEPYEWGGAFGYCINLKSIEIPSSINYIGIRTFEDCSNLIGITFEEGSQLDSIAGTAFCGCSSLTSFEIPSNVTSIGKWIESLYDRVFGGCSSLTSIYCYAENVPETGSYNNVFSGVPSDMVIYVPAQSVDAYKAAYPWNEYTILPLGTETVVCDVPQNLKVVVTKDDPNYDKKYKITLTWDAVEGAEGYAVYVASQYYPEGMWMGTVTSNEYINGTDTEGEWYFYVKTVCNGDLGIVSEPSERVLCVLAETETDVCDVPQNLKVVVTKDDPNYDKKYKITLTWDAVEGAEGYAVYVASQCYPEGMWMGTVTSNEYINGTDTEGEFYFYVKTICNGDLGIVSEPSERVLCVLAETEFDVVVATNIENAGIIAGAGTYSQGDTVTLTVTANEGYKFVNWTENGDVVSEEAEYSFEITKDRNLVANFEEIEDPENPGGNEPGEGNDNEDPENPGGNEPEQPGDDEKTCVVTAVANPEEGGSVSGAGTYKKDMTVTLKATAKSGYQFLNWTENDVIVSTENEYSFIVTKDINLIANFEKTTCNVTAVANPEEAGTITGTGTYVKNMSVTLTAKANEGYKFLNWTENGVIVSTESEYSFVVSLDTDLVANFVSTEGVEELTLSFNIYPNPVNDKLYIETEVEIEEVSIFDIYGRRQELSAISCQPSAIDVSGLNSGVYFVKVVTSEGEAVKRIVKK